MENLLLVPKSTYLINWVPRSWSMSGMISRIKFESPTYDSVKM
jgi:hypothetical protein